MFSSTGGRRLVLLIRRSAATAAGGTDPLQPQPHAALLPNRYYSSAPLATGTPDLDTASYLVASCGLSPAAAAAASRWVRIRSTAKADAILSLLRRHGLSDADIVRMLRMSPKILILNPDKIIRPKLEFFASLGVPATVLVRTPILERSLERHLVPYVGFLRGILGTDANIRAAVARHPYSLMFDLDKSMRPALEALRRHGLAEKALSKLIILQIGALVMTPSHIHQLCKDLEAIGLPGTDSRFPYAFRVMSSIKRETWLRKVALYQSFGVAEGELLKAFKKQPTIMSISEENIKEKLRFFLDTLKLDLRDVMGRPVAMGHSLKKSILPRCAVLSVLMREGKIERDINLLNALFSNSKVFSEKYVLRYADDVPDVVKAYEGKIKFKGFSDGMF